MGCKHTIENQKTSDNLSQISFKSPKSSQKSVKDRLASFSMDNNNLTEHQFIVRKQTEPELTTSTYNCSNRIHNEDLKYEQQIFSEKILLLFTQSRVKYKQQQQNYNQLSLLVQQHEKTYRQQIQQEYCNLLTEQSDKEATSTSFLGQKRQRETKLFLLMNTQEQYQQYQKMGSSTLTFIIDYASLNRIVAKQYQNLIDYQRHKEQYNELDKGLKIFTSNVIQFNKQQQIIYFDGGVVSLSQLNQYKLEKNFVYSENEILFLMKQLLQIIILFDKYNQDDIGVISPKNIIFKFGSTKNDGKYALYPYLFNIYQETIMEALSRSQISFEQNQYQQETKFNFKEKNRFSGYIYNIARIIQELMLISCYGTEYQSYFQKPKIYESLDLLLQSKQYSSFTISIVEALFKQEFETEEEFMQITEQLFSTDYEPMLNYFNCIEEINFLNIPSNLSECKLDELEFLLAQCQVLQLYEHGIKILLEIHQIMQSGNQSNSNNLNNNNLKRKSLGDSFGYEQNSHVSSSMEKSIKMQKEQIFLRLLDYYWRLEQFDQAIEFYQNNIKKQCQEFTQIVKINIYKMIGLIHDAKGNPCEAEHFYRKVIKLLQNIPEKERKNYSSIYNNLGSILQHRGNFLEALQCYQQAYDIVRFINGDRDSRLCPILHNLGSIYESLGTFEAAIIAYHNAIQVEMVNTKGRQTESIAISHCNLSLLYKNWGKYNHALEESKKAIVIYTKLYGKDNINLSSIYGIQGSIYFSQQMYVEAEIAFQQAINIEEKVSQADNPFFENQLNNYGYIFSKINNLKKNTKLNNNEYQLKDRNQYSQSYSIILNNMGYIQEALKKYELAEKYYQQALDYQVKYLGQNSANMKAFQENLKRIKQKIQTQNTSLFKSQRQTTF